MADHDRIGDLAHIITGSIGATCCHRTGGYSGDQKCECRCIAENLIDNREKVLAILERPAPT